MLFRRYALLLALAPGLMACSSDGPAANGDAGPCTDACDPVWDGAPEDSARVRLIHLAPDGPTVHLDVSDKSAPDVLAVSFSQILDAPLFRPGHYTARVVNDGDVLAEVDVNLVAGKPVDFIYHPGGLLALPAHTSARVVNLSAEAFGLVQSGAAPVTLEPAQASSAYVAASELGLDHNLDTVADLRFAPLAPHGDVFVLSATEPGVWTESSASILTKQMPQELAHPVIRWLNVSAVDLPAPLSLGFGESTPFTSVPPGFVEGPNGPVRVEFLGRHTALVFGQEGALNTALIDEPEVPVDADQTRIRVFNAATGFEDIGLTAIADGVAADLLLAGLGYGLPSSVQAVETDRFQTLEVSTNGEPWLQRWFPLPDLAGQRVNVVVAAQLEDLFVVVQTDTETVRVDGVTTPDVLIRAIHVAPALTPFNVSEDGKPVIDALGFAEGGRTATLRPGHHTLTVKPQASRGSTEVQTLETGLLRPGQSHSLVLWDAGDGPVLTLAEDPPAPSAAQVTIQVMHVSAAHDTLDVAMASPGPLARGEATAPETLSSVADGTLTVTDPKGTAHPFALTLTAWDGELVRIYLLDSGPQLAAIAQRGDGSAQQLQPATE